MVVGSGTKNFMVAFGSNDLIFSPLQNEFPAVMEDQEGNKYNLFGEVIEGSNLGEKLNAPISYMGYWFSWGTFYPDVVIYE